MTTSWIIPLSLYYGLVVAAHPNATTDVEAGVSFAIMCAAALLGDVMGLARAWQTRTWAWGIPLVILLILYLAVIPVAVFTSVLPSDISSLLTLLLVLAQMVALGAFGWWGPRMASARPKAPIATIATHA